ncbi:type II secretion system protein GspF, partial [Candidatus Falkowbacteria bacterium CG02_land_8_20_14_3_00_36_14]
IYPAIVLAGLTIVGVIMMVVVIPKLTSVFTESGAVLPLPTKILIAVSAFMAAYWWLFLLVIIAVIFGIRYLASTPRGRNLIDYFMLKLPIFGKLFQRIHLVRFTRSMNTLILGGVTINESLKISSEVVSNNVYKKLILDTIREVEKGNSISQVFANSQEIPKMVSEMLALGEKTGKLDLVLEKISDFYGREINNIVNNLMTLLEPVIMIVMGVGVGLMVAAIILPMYNMASQF